MAVANEIQHLLPSPDDTTRCVDHAHCLSIDPRGTALYLDRVVLVDVPLPWPKPFSSHKLLAPVADAFQDPHCRARLLAMAPTHSAANDGLITVEVHDRTDNGATVNIYRCEPEDLEQLVRPLATPGQDALPSRDANNTEPIENQTTLLVCTHGSHDVCCGALGTPLVNELDTIQQRGESNLRVKRVSHIGGHRFAPTAMSLPDGRMWAYLTSEEACLIGSRDVEVPPQLAAKCRGWWGAASGPAQVAELAVFGQLGWGIDRTHRSVLELGKDAITGDSAGKSAGQVFAVNVGEQQWRVGVGKGRTIPGVSCRKQGGLPFKLLDEYTADWVVGPIPQWGD